MSASDGILKEGAELKALCCAAKGEGPGAAVGAVSTIAPGAISAKPGAKPELVFTFPKLACGPADIEDCGLKLCGAGAGEDTST